MGDEDQYREIYRMLLRQIAVGSMQVKIVDLADFVVRIQREVVHRDQEDALDRLKNSLVTAFKSSSSQPEYITEEEFVACMLDVDKRAPWDHYDKYLKKTYESLKSSPQGIKFKDYSNMIERAFGVRVTPEMEEYLHEKLGDNIDLNSFINISGKFD
jgi:predicted metalloprotease with PDZ domain